MKNSLMFLALSAALVFGCKKDNETDSSATVKANLTKSWQAQKVEGKTPAGITLNVYTKGSTTNLIDALGTFYVTFKSDGKFERSSLDPSSTQPETGTWTLGSDNKTITMVTSTGATLTYVADPVTANSATFKYNINVTNPTGIDALIVARAQAFGQSLPAGSYLNFYVVPK
ncbi:hypothetical protein [Siphonobacter sp. SORGH_AS_0500]|uniref:hypothetical protein n=1 Tax=Siphonobacter sp. SORGH_AS_0500 TaxID=1864824 RepID=UPI0012FE9047|nr:hypothetical protein [Siphonobacter sp. SORGH_AS_0500]